MGLHLSPALNRPAEGDRVGILHIAAHRNAVGNPTHLDAQWLNDLGQIQCGRFSFDIGVGRNNDLLHRTGAQAVQEGGNLEFIRPNTIEGG